LFGKFAIQSCFWFFFASLWLLHFLKIKKNKTKGGGTKEKQEKNLFKKKPNYVG
jgi:hypothetical protein